MSASDVASSLPIPEALLPYLTGQLHDYSSMQESIYRFNIAFGILVLVALVLRMYVRLYIIRAAGFDDALMVLAVLSALVLFSACLAGAHYGLGKHIWNLDANLLNISGEASHLVKIEFAAYILYATAISFTKFAIIASYIRLFPHVNIRRVSFATGFVVMAFWICSLFAICFACYPIRALWDWTIVGASCFPLVNYFYVAAAFNIATDVTLCVLPIPTLWSLKMPKAQRVVVSILFSFGLFACVASILRLIQLHSLNGVDISYQTASALNWSTAEVGTAIVCSCISVLRPLASKIFPKFFQRLFTQASNPSLDTYATAKLSKSLTSQTGPQMFASHSDDAFELIHQRPDTAEYPPPPTTLQDMGFRKATTAKS